MPCWTATRRPSAATTLINIAGSSRYFTERPPVADYDELDRRMRSGELSMVVEIPPGFGRDVERRLNGLLAAADAGGPPSPGAGGGQLKPVAIGVWVDGAMPQRAETIRGYVRGHAPPLAPGRRPASTRPAPATRRGPAPTGFTRQHRVALPLQPGRQEPGGNGAGGDPAAPALDPGDVGDAFGGPREGPRLDHQFLRNADDPPGVPAGQTAPLRDPRVCSISCFCMCSRKPFSRCI